MYTVEFPVRYYECDPMRVVHHTEYLRYFELARNRWLFDHGYTQARADEDHLVLPVVSLECSYKHSARFDETLVATLEGVSFNRAKLVVHQTVCELDGTVCAEGTVTLAFLNTLTGHVMRCPEQLAKLFENEINQSL